MSAKLPGCAWSIQKTLLVLLFVSQVAVLAGCGRHPAVARDNRRLISSLRTALSAKNPQWLDQNIALIQEKRTNGEMSDVEYEAFQRIIVAAKSGNWKEAEEEVVAFQKAQRPTAEEIERIRKHSVSD